MAQQAGSEPGSGGAGYLGQVDRALEDLAADTGDEALHRRMFGVDAPGGWAAPMVFPWRPAVPTRAQIRMAFRICYVPTRRGAASDLPSARLECERGSAAADRRRQGLLNDGADTALTALRRGADDPVARLDAVGHLASAGVISGG
jgi:hypothetical protein